MAVTPFPIGIPADVNLNDVRSRAKALLKSAHAGENAALERIKPFFDDPPSLTLQRAQLVTAREFGFSSWHKLKAFVDARDELAECQRKHAALPYPKQGWRGRPGLGPDSEWQRSAAELRRLTRSIAAMFDAGLDGSDIACCTFCFKPQPEAGKFIAGDRGFICDECVDRCASLMQESPETSAPDDRDHLPCSFCHKPATEVDNIVTASNSSICNTCLDLCQQIVAGNPPPLQNDT